MTFCQILWRHQCVVYDKAKTGEKTLYLCSINFNSRLNRINTLFLIKKLFEDSYLFQNKMFSIFENTWKIYFNLIKISRPMYFILTRDYFDRFMYTFHERFVFPRLITDKNSYMNIFCLFKHALIVFSERKKTDRKS